MKTAHAGAGSTLAALCLSAALAAPLTKHQSAISAALAARAAGATVRAVQTGLEEAGFKLSLAAVHRVLIEGLNRD